MYRIIFINIICLLFIFKFSLGQITFFENSDLAFLDNKVIKLAVSKNNFNGFNSVELVSSSQNFIVNSANSGIFIEKNGIEYGSVFNTPVVSLETDREDYKVLLVRGSLQSNTGSFLVGNNNENISYTIRFYVYLAPAEYIKVILTIENSGYFGSRNELRFSRLIFKTEYNLLTQKHIYFSNYNRAYTTQDFRLLQLHEIVNQSNESENFSYRINVDDVQEKTGSRIKGIVDVSDSEKGISHGIRYFWQNHPSAITVDENIMGFDILPNTGDEYVIRGGQRKSYEMMFLFHDGDLSNSDTTLINQFLDPTFDLAEGLSIDQIKNTWKAPLASYRLSTSDPVMQSAFNRYEDYQLMHFTPSLTRNGHDMNYLRDHLILGQWYGYHMWGDILWLRNPQGIPSKLHYDWPYGMLLHYIRSGNLDFYRFGYPMALCQSDLIFVKSDGYSHTGRNLYESGEYAGTYDHYHNNHIPMPSHSWYQGMALQYLLTNDRRYFDVLEHATQRVYWYWNDYEYRNVEDLSPLVWPSWNNTTSETRVQCWTIETLLAFYSVVGDIIPLGVNSNRSVVDEALQIFESGLLRLEHRDGSNGYLIHNDSGEPDVVNMFFHGIHGSVLSGLHSILVKLPKYTNDIRVNNLRDYLMRLGDFCRTMVYGGDMSNGNYRPFQCQFEWDIINGEAKQIGGEMKYNLMFADLFSYLFVITGNEEWMELARQIFKDGVFYYDKRGDQYFNPNDLSLLDYDWIPQISKQRGWMLRFGQLYLSIESNNDNHKPSSPQIPKNLRIR